MDIHIVPGVKAREVADAHRRDVMIEQEHECKCLTYWIDEERGNIFCLIEAPTKEAVNNMHDKSHGLIPNRIIEVNSDVVGSFLGRIYDPIDTEITDDGLKIFKDPSFRILLIVKIADPTLLKYKVGGEKAREILGQYYSIIRSNLQIHQGREVEEKGPGFITSFSSASKAVACALAIQQDLSTAGVNMEGFKIGISAGEPVAKSEALFGDTILLANQMCSLNKKFRVIISAEVDELIAKDYSPERRQKVLGLSPQDQLLLSLVYQKLEAHWQDADFNVSEFCNAMAMSKSQVYRKILSIFGNSPVLLLKDFRLNKAKELMRKQRYNISEITFASGFTSPSYFTKCFKKKYALLPMTYIDLLH